MSKQSMYTGTFPKGKGPAQIRQSEGDRQRGFKGAGKGPEASCEHFGGGAAPKTAMTPFKKGVGA